MKPTARLWEFSGVKRMTEMLQKTENVSKNVANENSQYLTEKWKQGELPEGWYYVKGSRAEGIYAYTAEYLNNMYRPRNDERIIEQVPSYEQWQASYNCMLENEVLRLKNAQLKELLRHIVAEMLRRGI